MAHLIKLEDYISRYQFDLHRYPSQYSRMKKERWYYLKTEWEQAQYEQPLEEETEAGNAQDEEQESNLFKRILQKMNVFKKSEATPAERASTFPKRDPRLKSYTLDQLKGAFLDELFNSQLRWASSSLIEESTLHPSYKREKWLRFFTQQLPDNYFLMYKPVFYVKKAPIDLDIVLISPTEIICITLIEGQENSIFDANDDRFWVEHIEQEQKKKLSPLLSMKRMSGVIEWIFEKESFSYPIRQVIVSPTSYIDKKRNWANVQYIDRRTFEEWHEQLKRHPSPLKHDQMKVTSLLFHYCSTSSQQRDVAEEQVENDEES